jgi:hypothetical protein
VAERHDGGDQPVDGYVEFDGAFCPTPLEDASELAQDRCVSLEVDPRLAFGEAGIEEGGMGVDDAPRGIGVGTASPSPLGGRTEPKPVRSPENWGRSR